MPAKTPAGCAHRETQLLAYLSTATRGLSVLWCVDCGAVCRTDAPTVWQAPKGPPKAKGRAPRK